MNEEILKIIKERGLLLEKSVFELIDGLDQSFVKEFLINIERISGQKFISLSLLNKNVEFVKSVVSKLGNENKKIIENTFIRFGISLEIRKELEVVDSKYELKKENIGYKVFYANTRPDKKIEVRDFTSYFRARYQSLQRILMQRPELQQNLVSINKISGERTNLSIIGIVVEKRVTKNKNLMIKFEDLTGRISALARFDSGMKNRNGESIFEKASELLMDDVVGIKASGNSDMLFIQDIFFPDSFLYEKKKFEEDFNIVFLSDMHCGSDRHLGRGFKKFLNWIDSEDSIAKKVKYIFFSGDNVDGVGIFPGQEPLLNLKSMKEQYELLASYLNKIPKRITIFMCPGQHDATRVAEPQPIISKRYAPQLYEIENLILVTNPCLIKLLEKNKEFNVLMYHGASIHSFINEIRELRELKAHRCPAKAVRHMLKRRHLAPSHGEVVYIPNAEVDPLVIQEVPDVLCTGEVHRLDIETYNGSMIITGSCWQAQTSFEEKVGNIPDPCKVPILNLKTRELKVYDFSDEEEIAKWM